MKKIKLIKIKKHEVLKAWILEKIGFWETLKKYKDYKTSPVTQPLFSFYKKSTNKSADNYWVLYNGKTAGAICIGCKENCMWIGRFYILPKYRNKGIGQQALHIAEALYPNAKRWHLDTIFEEKNNIHLYEKLGYIPCGVGKKINKRMTIIDYEKRIKNELY